jgi:hypothetical protein
MFFKIDKWGGAFLYFFMLVESCLEDNGVTKYVSMDKWFEEYAEGLVNAAVMLEGECQEGD